jgi:hypothetical protein
LTQVSKSFTTSGQFCWDSTSLSLAATCPRKYYYKLIEGWQPDRRSVHLEFGGHYATALEHYFKHLAAGLSSDDALIEIVKEALIATWEYDLDEEGNPIPDTGAPWESMHNLKTRETLIRTIVWYFDHFRDDPTSVIMLANGVPGVEYTFKLPVDNDLIFSGHIDRLVSYSDNPYIMDQKTTGTTISARFFSEFDLSLQMSMYTFVGKIIYNLPVKGAIIDGAQIAVGFTRFERGFTFRSEPQLEEWYEEMQGIAAGARKNFVQWQDSADAERAFPRNLTACGNYGGCEFREICAKPKQFRDQFLRGSFTKKTPWDPMNNR